MHKILWGFFSQKMVINILTHIAHKYFRNLFNCSHFFLKFFYCPFFQFIWLSIFFFSFIAWNWKFWFPEQCCILQSEWKDTTPPQEAELHHHWRLEEYTWGTSLYARPLLIFFPWHLLKDTVTPSWILPDGCWMAILYFLEKGCGVHFLL